MLPKEFTVDLSHSWRSDKEQYSLASSCIFVLPEVEYIIPCSGQSLQRIRSAARH